MGQRLGTASALLGDPGTLILDEPVNGLDAEGILWIRNLLRDLAAEGRAVFVSSCLMSEMALTSDHLIVFGRGRLIPGTSSPTRYHKTESPLHVRRLLAAVNHAVQSLGFATAPLGAPFRALTPLLAPKSDAEDGENDGRRQAGHCAGQQRCTVNP